MPSHNQIGHINNNLTNHNTNQKEDSMEDSEEDETKVSVEEEDEVMGMYNAIIVVCWGIINENSPTCSHNVPTVQLRIVLLKIVHS